MQSQSLVLSQKTLRQTACGAVMTRQFEAMTTATRDKSPWRAVSFFFYSPLERIMKRLFWKTTTQINHTQTHAEKSIWSATNNSIYLHFLHILTSFYFQSFVANLLNKYILNFSMVVINRLIASLIPLQKWQGEKEELLQFDFQLICMSRPVRERWYEETL